MKRLPTILALAAAASLATPAEAGVFLSASFSNQTTHLLYTSSETQYGSATLDLELGQYVRIGYTYGLEVSKSTTYKDPSALSGEQQNATGYCQVNCDRTYTNQNVTSHAVGLTIVLYNGAAFTPFLLAGVIKKIVTIESLDYDHTGNLVYTPPESPPEPIGPYVGLGMALRMTRSFSLKFTYQISPGYVLLPQDPTLHTIWDRQWTAGLQYQL